MIFWLRLFSKSVVGTGLFHTYQITMTCSLETSVPLLYLYSLEVKSEENKWTQMSFSPLYLKGYSSDQVSWDSDAYTLTALQMLIQSNPFYLLLLGLGLKKCKAIFLINMEIRNYFQEKSETISETT